MPDGSIDITGTGNFAASGVSNSTINASIVIGKSGEYRELKDHLDTLQKLFDKTPENETQERLALSAKINEQKAFLRSFEQDVVKLAETFDKIDLNSERLQKAKEHFDNGEITEARVLLEDAEEERADKVVRALAKQKESQEILQNAAAEYLILAQATALNLENPNRFEDTCRYYEQSIAAFASFDNLFANAHFLQGHRQYKEAMSIYERLKVEFASDLAAENLALMFNSLGELHRDQNEHEKAEGEYRNALNISRKFEVENPHSYQMIVASVLNNLGLLHTTQKKYKIAENEFNESLSIKGTLSWKDNTVSLFDIAATQNNLGELYRYQNKFQKAEGEYRAALEKYRIITIKDRQLYLPYVGLVLNNLGALYCDQGIYERNLKAYEAADQELSEAIQIRRELAVSNPQAFLPDLAMTLNNLGELYRRQAVYSKAEEAFDESLNIYKELSVENPSAFLPLVATISNNLALIYEAQEQYDKAEEKHIEILEVRRKLAEENPLAFEIDVAQTLYNLTRIYSFLNEPEKMGKCVKETIRILEKYEDEVPYIEGYLKNVREISKYLELDEK